MYAHYVCVDLFKLEYANKNGILYNATRTEDSFNVKVSYILG